LISTMVPVLAMGLLGSFACRNGRRAFRIGSAAALHRDGKAPAEPAYPSEARIQLDAATSEPGALEAVRNAVGMVDLSGDGRQLREHTEIVGASFQLALAGTLRNSEIGAR